MRRGNLISLAVDGPISGNIHQVLFGQTQRAQTAMAAHPGPLRVENLIHGGKLLIRIFPYVES